MSTSFSSRKSYGGSGSGYENLHGRSGSVALPLVKLAPARTARLEVTDADRRRADRVAIVRRSEVDIVSQLKLTSTSYIHNSLDHKAFITSKLG